MMTSVFYNTRPARTRPIFFWSQTGLNCPKTDSLRPHQWWTEAGGRNDMSSFRGRRSALRRRADGNVGAVSRAQHVLTLTAAAA